MTIYLSQIGLLIDMVGVFILIKYGLPSKIKSIYSSVVTEHSDSEIIEIEKENKKITKRANWGVWLILFGFIIQFISIWFATPIYSSSKELTKFQVYSSNYNSTVTLYSDSTFKEVKNQKGLISNYSGTWTGCIAKDSTITTVAGMVNFSIITLMPTSTYCFTDNNAVLVKSGIQ